MKEFIKSILKMTPYRVIRANETNRFGAIDDQLLQLKNRDYQPQIIIDGGAHRGTFSLAAHKLWPNADFYLIDPQPACAEYLKILCKKMRFNFCFAALTDSETAINGQIFLSDHDGPNTGAHVVQNTAATGERTIEVPSITLDKIFEGKELNKSA
jgi:FkbM family methyltransferase